MKRNLIILVFTLLGLLALATVPAQEPDATPTVADLWDPIAKAHIRPGRIGSVSLNVVDYGAIKADPRWPVLLDALARATEPVERNERLAFWINAYNIMAIKVVLSKYPIDSIKDVGGWITRVWDVDAGLVAGKMRSLGEIEHDILRPMKEPRIHSAVVCASVSCPPLRTEAFRADQLDEQLNAQMREWLSNEKTGLRFDESGRTLWVSWIFTYFKEDFDADGGSLLKFLKTHLPEDLRSKIGDNVRIRAMDYDWSLNDTRRSRGGAK